MSSNLSKKLETGANIGIIVVAVLIGAMFVQRYFFPQPAGANRPEPTIGAKVNLPEISPTRPGAPDQAKTLIMALQTTCHYCNESAPFYKRLIESVQNKNIKLIAVFPTSPEEGKAHLEKLGLNNLEVRQSSLDSIQVGGTPTLILTDGQGAVTNYWVGKLSPEEETEVISKISS